jgi:hypothetical protein
MGKLGGVTVKEGEIWCGGVKEELAITDRESGVGGSVEAVGEDCCEEEDHEGRWRHCGLRVVVIIGLYQEICALVVSTHTNHHSSPTYNQM